MAGCTPQHTARRDRAMVPIHDLNDTDLLPDLWHFLSLARAEQNHFYQSEFLESVAMSVFNTLSRLIRIPQDRGRDTNPHSAGPEMGLLFGTTPKPALPVCLSSAEEQAQQALFDTGRFLARQDSWASLGARLRAADEARALTPAGIPEAELLAEGARADAVGAALRAVALGDDMRAAAIIQDLMQVLDEAPDDHGIASVVAMAHIDIGWAWRGERWDKDLPATHRAAFYWHFREAAKVVDRYDAFERNAPLLAALRCALLTAETRPCHRACDDYEDLIDLAPGIAKYMRALGNHMLPRWFGSYEKLEEQARKTMQRTSDLWGAGGYSWTYLDALSVDNSAYALLDGDLFCTGLRDILARQGDQHVVNSFAAYTGVAMRPSGVNAAARAQIATCFAWIVEDHLREVHPRIWYAANGVWASRLEHQDRLTKGQQRASAALDRHARGIPPVTAPGQ